MGRRKKSTPQKKGTKKHFQTANKQFTNMMYSRGKNRQEMIRYKSGKADSSRQLTGHSREAFPALVTKTVSADARITATGISFPDRRRQKAI